MRLPADARPGARGHRRGGRLGARAWRSSRSRRTARYRASSPPATSRPTGPARVASGCGRGRSTRGRSSSRPIPASTASRSTAASACSSRMPSQPPSTLCAGPRSTPPATRGSSPTCARPARRSSTTCWSSSASRRRALRRMREPLERTGRSWRGRSPFPPARAATATRPSSASGPRPNHLCLVPVLHPKTPWTTCSSRACGRPSSPRRPRSLAGSRGRCRHGTVERLVARGRLDGYSSMSPALVGAKPHASK